MDFFDNHIHITRLPRPLEMARELHGRGYKYMSVACEPWEWKVVQELQGAASAEGWLEGCNFSFGVHPEIVGKIQEQDLRDLTELLKAFPDAQVGETGLDKRYAGYEPGGIQEEIFRRQAKMALEFGRDLQIHCVGDYARVVKILRETGFSDSRCARPIFHRFGGDAGIVKAGITLGAIFSIHADSFRKKATREALALIPAESLRFETDADETFVRDNAETPQEIADRLVKTLQGTIDSI